jgi:iron complex transport system substrate-binding protein
MKNKMALFLVLVLVLFSFAGCASNVDNSSTPQGSQEESQGEMKIITAYTPATDFILALGGKDNLVGVDDKSAKSELLKNIDPKNEILGVGSKKNGINVEQVISLDPDLVILYPVEESDNTKKQLEDNGIKVISINPETLESLQSDITTIGEAIGKEKEAEELNAYINEKVSMVKDRVKDIDEKKTVYLAGSRGVLSTHSGDFFQHEIIDIAGGEDLSKDLVGGWNEISAEQLIQWNPEVMVTVNYSPDNRESILQDKSLSSIKALEEKQVYEIPSKIDSWDTPKPSAVLSFLWMGKTLYPEAFEDVDLTKEANGFYEKFYGKSFEDLGGNIIEGEQQQ